MYFFFCTAVHRYEIRHATKRNFALRYASRHPTVPLPSAVVYTQTDVTFRADIQDVQCLFLQRTHAT